MTICAMCLQNRECQPLYFGEERVRVAENVCRGCRMNVEKCENLVTLSGYQMHLARQPHLFELRRFDAPETETGGERESGERGEEPSANGSEESQEGPKEPRRRSGAR